VILKAGDGLTAAFGCPWRGRIMPSGHATLRCRFRGSEGYAQALQDWCGSPHGSCRFGPGEVVVRSIGRGSGRNTGR
jgi:hypothetical protein